MKYRLPLGWVLAAGLAGCFGGSRPAAASPLQPNGHVSLYGTSAGPQSPLVGPIQAKQILHFVLVLPGNKTVSGIVQDTIIHEAASHNLDFYYRIATNSPLNVPYIDFVCTGFKDVTTDVDYRLDVPGLAAPQIAARTADGDAILFHFPASGIFPGPGQCTRSFFIRTNGKGFKNGAQASVKFGNVVVKFPVFCPVIPE